MKRDEELIMLYRLGDQNALEELFQRYKKPIFNFALRMLKNQADAEDALGQVFYLVTSKKDSYREIAKFSTWLYTIARNVCISRLRGRKRVVFLWFQKPQTSEYEQLDIPDTSTLPNIEAQEKDTAFYVKRAIEELPLEQKEALVLRQYQNLSYDEISAVLGCSLEKVKILIYRARQSLKRRLLPLIEEGA